MYEISLLFTSPVFTLIPPPLFLCPVAILSELNPGWFLPTRVKSLRIGAELLFQLDFPTTHCIWVYFIFVELS